MKEKKTKQLRVRLTESQVKMIINHIVEHPNEFRNQSDLVRESILDKICRKGQNKRGKTFSN